MIKVGFKKISDEAKLPMKAHATDSGFDLFVSEDVSIKPGETKVIKTGIAIKMPPGYEAQVRPRSGITSKTDLRVQLGTIDNDYTGEIGIIVDNISGNQSNNASYVYRDIKGDFIDASNICEGTYYEVKKGDKLAQLVIAPIPGVEVYEFDDDYETVRGSNGFGSTDESEESILGSINRSFNEVVRNSKVIKEDYIS